MPLRPDLPDYQPVTNPAAGKSKTPKPIINEVPASVAKPEAAVPSSTRARLIKNGHTLSYYGLFLFTAVLYFRPYELIPALSFLDRVAFVLAIVTLVIFIPSQLAVEGTLTFRPREINLLLLLCVAGLLSIPLALSPGKAWNEFNDVFIKAVLMFIVLVNVLRSKTRLRMLLYLALSVTVLLSVNAIRDYRAGNFAPEGERINGLIGGMFGNPNDLALHFVTMAPIAIGLMFASKRLLGKLIFATIAGLTVMANVVTFSRGGFLGLLATAFVLIWKIGREHRLAVVVFTPIILVIFIVAAPGSYGSRLMSIFVRDMDTHGTANTRQEILYRSILVSIRNPITGIGMGNFPTMSVHETVTHNAFTQVSAEMGTAALIVYLMFLTAPIRRLRKLEKRSSAEQSRFYYYLSIGLQASLIGYMVSAFFAAVAYQWYAYYLVGYALSLWRLFEAEPASEVNQVSSSKVLTPAPVYPGFQRGEANSTF